jgi:hypothetical protein
MSPSQGLSTNFIVQSGLWTRRSARRVAGVAATFAHELGRSSEEIASDSGGSDVSRKRAPEQKKAILERVALYLRVKLRSRALAVPATCGPQVQPLSGRVPQHGEEVTHGAQQHEHVPDEMAVPHAFRRIERDAGRVGEASGD